MMEKTLGIQRDWVQPTYYRETVDRWFRKRRSTATGANGSAVLFSACTVHYSGPLVDRAAVEVIE